LNVIGRTSPVARLQFQQAADMLILTFCARPCTRSLLFWGFLEELNQPVDQPSAPANDVQSTLVLMFFQNLVQISFQLAHDYLPLKIRGCGSPVLPVPPIP
jgi:hypothetical protein